MKFSLAEIRRKTENAVFYFEREVDASEVKKLHEDIRDISPVLVKGNCVVDGDRYIISLEISGELILPCARTLVAVPYPFHIKEVEVFSISADGEDDDDAEEIIFPIEGEVIDLAPSIHENILLAVPYRVFSDDPEVLNRALMQGKGWELTLQDDEQDDKKREDAVDPRLMKLQSLLNNKKDQ